MEKEDLLQLLEQGGFPGRSEPVRMVETHISWVLLTPDFAFKFKKPVDLGFLDFSSLEKRLYYCEEELRLNQRLAPGMYLAVLPLIKSGNVLGLGTANGGTVIDYAVQMRRMEEAYQLDGLLQHGTVPLDDLRLLAAQLATFHLANRLLLPEEVRPEQIREDFDDLFRFDSLLLACLGAEAVEKLHRIRAALPIFFEQHGQRFLQRAEAGFWVEGHGDLHSRNIFLLPGQPIVFDCIEFSPAFRKLDVLSELAFLCMDLDFQGRADLSSFFLEAYQQYWVVMPQVEDKILFQFFKAYRANVRLKVVLLQWESNPSSAFKEQAERYFRLILEEMPDHIGAVD